MKQSRRHELKTNELAESLVQFKEWFNKYGNYVLGGVAAVVLIIGGASYYSRSEASRVEQSWSEYRQIDQDFVKAAGTLQQGPLINPGQKEKLLDLFQRMEALANNAQDGALSSEAWRWIGDRRLMLASIYTSDQDIAEALTGAETAYTRAINADSERTFDVLAAKFGLATVYETTGAFDKARKIYEEVAAREDPETTVQQKMASKKLKNFDRLRIPVVLAAAPEPPASQPSATPPIQKTPAASAPSAASAASKPAPKLPQASSPKPINPATRPAVVKPQPTTKPAG